MLGVVRGDGPGGHCSSLDGSSSARLPRQHTRPLVLVLWRLELAVLAQLQLLVPEPPPNSDAIARESLCHGTPQYGIDCYRNLLVQRWRARRGCSVNAGRGDQACRAGGLRTLRGQNYPEHAVIMALSSVPHAVSCTQMSAWPALQS